MKLRYKILITIAAALLYVYCVQQYGSHKVRAVYSVADLQQVYANDNTEYFGDRLPKNTVIDYDEHDDKSMATTRLIGNNRFRIALNKDYTADETTARLTLLHEECHIKTWSQELEEHGRRWKSCMLVLDAQGAFREAIIGGYREH